MVRQLSSGRCLSLCLGLKEKLTVEEVVQALRDVCGPSNASLAASVRPNSLRAKFSGKNLDENGVHCTDLPEDAVLELEYFFKIIKDR
jgi:nucleoside-diphosphate kinase